MANVVVYLASTLGKEEDPNVTDKAEANIEDVVLSKGN